MVAAYIYVEGGASGPSSKYLTIRCQQAFHKLLDRMGFQGRKPRLKACGRRDAVYDDFCTAHQTGNATYVAMWLDSEEPMSDIEQAWRHLGSVTTVSTWQKPAGASDEQVLFMTTCMETWIVADRVALRGHYKNCLNEKALPPSSDLERRSRESVQDALGRATKDCSNAYAKGKRSYEVLEQLDPSTLRRLLPSFTRADRILKSKL